MQWLQAARGNQLPPEGNWHTWLLLAGRGFGKTRAGAEETAWQALKVDNRRIAVVAPTAADARDTCVEGESGLLAAIPPACVSVWNRSQGELWLTNGSRIKLFSADAPERLRGPQHHFAWCDEVAAWREPEALDQVRFGLRLGPAPRLVLTTTPQPVGHVKEIAAEIGHGVVLTRGSTFDNAAHLSPVALDELRKRYEGTRLGRQELYAEILDEVEGALWSRELIDRTRVKQAPELVRLVIAVDPAVTHGENADSTGIVACGLGADGHAYVLRDATCKLSPDAWARRVVALHESLEADLVVGEVNQGGDLVEAVLRTVAPLLPFKAVTASRGKVFRAEPVAALYEQGMVHHVGVFHALEEQMCGFTASSSASPDRVDALVWALAELMFGRSQPRVRSVL